MNDTTRKMADDPDRPTLVASSTASDQLHLPPASRVGRYELLEVLGQGGFGITYRARDVELHRDVAVKEYLPVEFAFRGSNGSVVARPGEQTDLFAWGLNRFSDEARTLASLENVPGVVNVHDIVMANGTAYMVMAYVRGQTLDARLKDGKPLDQQAIERLLPALLDGLEMVHKAGFLHRDIKPSNILLGGDGRPTLIDFGAARVAIAGRTQAITTVYTPGYAPFEQYTSERQGPPADIYALGATLYHAVAGQIPLAASDRVINDRLSPALLVGKGRYAPSLLAAIDAALKLKAIDRPQTIDAWRRMLVPKIGLVKLTGGQSRRWPRRLAVGALAVFLVGVTLYAWDRSGTVDATLTRAGSDRPVRQLPKGADVAPRSGHVSGVNAVAFSKDGRSVVSASDDRTLKLWSVATGGLFHTFEGHRDWVKSVAFSPDGRSVVSGSVDRTLKLWDVATGRPLRSFEGHRDRVESVAFAPDGLSVVSGSADRTLKLWDANTGRLLRTFEGYSDWGWSVAFSPDGLSIVSGSADKTLTLWDVATGRLLRTFQGHGATVSSVAFSPDGLSIVSGSYDKTLKLWDAATGRLLRTFEEHGKSVWSVAFAPDGRSVISGSTDKTLTLWDVATGRLLRTFEGHSDSVWSVAFAPDGRSVISGSADKTLKLWDLATGRLVRTF